MHAPEVEPSMAFARCQECVQHSGLFIFVLLIVMLYTVMPGLFGLDLSGNLS